MEEAASRTSAMVSGGPSRLLVHAVRLTPGQELYTTLLQYVKTANLSSAFILSCCGSVTNARLRLAAHTAAQPNNTIKDYVGPFEIVSLVGTLSGDEGHLHISLSDRDGHMLGGHVIGDLHIFTTAEVMIGECADLTFKREFDESTGFPELVVLPKPDET